MDNISLLLKVMSRYCGEKYRLLVMYLCAMFMWVITEPGYFSSDYNSPTYESLQQRAIKYEKITSWIWFASVILIKTKTKESKVHLLQDETDT